MVRNRYLRIQRGRWLTEQGQSKNKCGHCGKLKRGHVCTALGSKADAVVASAPSPVSVQSCISGFEAGGFELTSSDSPKPRVVSPLATSTRQESTEPASHDASQAHKQCGPGQLARVTSLELLAAAAAGVAA